MPRELHLEGRGRSDMCPWNRGPVSRKGGAVFPAVKRGCRTPKFCARALGRLFNASRMYPEVTSASVPALGSAHILIVGIQGRLITKQDALRAVDDMIEVGWRCGPELYREIIRLIRAL